MDPMSLALQFAAFNTFASSLNEGESTDNGASENLSGSTHAVSGGLDMCCPIGPNCASFRRSALFPILVVVFTNKELPLHIGASLSESILRDIETTHADSLRRTQCTSLKMPRFDQALLGFYQNIMRGLISAIEQRLSEGRVISNWIFVQYSEKFVESMDFVPVSKPPVSRLSAALSPLTSKFNFTPRKRKVWWRGVAKTESFLEQAGWQKIYPISTKKCIEQRKTSLSQKDCEQMCELNRALDSLSMEEGSRKLDALLLLVQKAGRSLSQLPSRRDSFSSLEVRLAMVDSRIDVRIIVLRVQSLLVALPVAIFVTDSSTGDVEFPPVTDVQMGHLLREELNHTSIFLSFLSRLLVANPTPPTPPTGTPVR
eukprot:GILK01005680.1.p1 GENE.GILK01005680.1~~GILK01005680.1.p1  ORF type:complete len:415 (-),score=49.51 GILK01005680.1:129-1241(-)